MLFLPTNNIFKYVYYDEITSILFIEYVTKQEKVYYRLDRKLFQQIILPLLRNNKDFRHLLFWGLHHGMVAQIDKNHPDVKLIDLTKFRGF